MINCTFEPVFWEHIYDIFNMKTRRCNCAIGGQTALKLEKLSKRRKNYGTTFDALI
jgi:hypothetical protein